jgi:hypothetical protein
MVLLLLHPDAKRTIRNHRYDPRHSGSIKRSGSATVHLPPVQQRSLSPDHAPTYIVLHKDTAPSFPLISCSSYLKSSSDTVGLFVSISSGSLISQLVAPFQTFQGSCSTSPTLHPSFFDQVDLESPKSGHGLVWTRWLLLSSICASFAFAFVRSWISEAAAWKGYPVPDAPPQGHCQ